MIGSWLLGRCACLHYSKFIRCSCRYQDLVYESCVFVRWCKIVVWSVCFGAICYEVFGQSTVMFLMKSAFSKDLFTMAEWYPSPLVNMCCTRTCLVYMFTIVRDIEWYSEIHIIIQKPNLLKRTKGRFSMFCCYRQKRLPPGTTEGRRGWCKSDQQEVDLKRNLHSPLLLRRVYCVTGIV